MQRARRNKNTPLVPSGSSGYNKPKEINKCDSYTGSTTGIRAEKSPLKNTTKFTASKKTTITPKKTERTRSAENYWQEVRKAHRELTKPLPRTNDAPKKDESNFSLSAGRGLKSDTKNGGFSLNDDVARKANLPTTTEHDFGKGLFGEKEEKNLYNKMVYEIFGPKKTEREFFLEGFEGKEQEIPDDISYLVPKQDIQRTQGNNLKLPLDTIPQSRMEAFAKIRDKNATRNAQDETIGSKIKSLNPDATEFGEDSETYKILQDLSKRWYETLDPAEKDRLHGVAEDVRRLARGKNRVKYGTDEIFDLMHKNAIIGQLVKAGSFGTIPVKTNLTNPLLAGLSSELLEPAAFLTTMVIDKNQWNYKYNDYWRVGGDEDEKRGEKLKYFDGKDLDVGNNRNWLPWIYFDGYLIGADKFGNMNMAYVGKKMGLPEWVYRNFTTMDDPEDIFWIDKGTDYAKSGR